MLRTKWILVSILFLLCQTAFAYTVSPAKWEIVYDYEITPQFANISIDNTHNASISIRLSIYTDPANTKQGYEPLPKEHFNWIRFKETDITVPPHTKCEIPVIIDVANQSENYNKNWQFYVKIDQYAGGDANGTAIFQYDYNLLWTIKTPNRYVPPSEREGNKPAEKTMPLLFIAVLLIIGVFIWYMYSKRKNKNAKNK